MLAATALVAAGGCGDNDDEGLSREEFSQQLQSIIEEPSSEFARLAEQGAELKSADVLSDDFKTEIGAVGKTMGQASEELDALTPPEDAEQQTNELIEALQQRSVAFEQAAREKNITLREFAPSLRETGERVDRAKEALRQEGYLSEAEEGD